MIYFYNETDIPLWEIVDKNEYFYRIKLKQPDAKNGFGIDIIKNKLAMDSFFLEVLEDEVAAKPDKIMWALGAMSFGVCYNNKTGLPFLKPEDEENEYTYDLFILSYKLDEGYTIVNEKANRFSILYANEDKENGIIHLVAIARPSNNPFFYLTFATEDGENYITKHLVTVKREGTVNLFINHMTKAEVEASKYKSIIMGRKTLNGIKISNTRVPYGIIVYPGDREDVLETCYKRYHKNPKFTKFIDQNSDKLEAKLKECKNKGHYTAATFYVDKPYNVITEADIKDIKYTGMFVRVNFLCSDGKMKSFN